MAWFRFALAFGLLLASVPRCGGRGLLAPPNDGGSGKVAVLSVGQLRDATRYGLVQRTQDFLVTPLASEGFHVDVYVCVQRPEGRALEGVHYAGARTVTVMETGEVTEAPLLTSRLRMCFREMLRDERGGRYDWVVRTRPDLMIFKSIPPLGRLRQDTVYARARVAGPGLTPLSWAEVSIDNVCIGGHKENNCKWFDRPLVEDTSGVCMIMDDQFAIIPGRFAPYYFDAEHPGAPVYNYSIPTGFAGKLVHGKHEGGCGWLEGAMTCRVLQSGARLEPVAVDARISRFCDPAGEKRDGGQCAPDWGTGRDRCQ